METLVERSMLFRKLDNTIYKSRKLRLVREDQRTTTCLHEYEYYARLVFDRSFLRN